ncbi:MAG TPA: hypothetical protein PKD61_12465 [Polyangiaceae bacterium]|nr:hypothetical protein [Polyangiaceae bacterium]
MLRILAVASLALALVACSKKKKPPPRPIDPPTARPRAAPNPADLPVALAVSRLGVFVAMAGGRVEKRPLGPSAARRVVPSGPWRMTKRAPSELANAKLDASTDAASNDKPPLAEPDSADAKVDAAGADTARTTANVVANGKGVRAMAAARDGSLLAVTHEFAHGREIWLYDQATLSIHGRLGKEADGQRRLLLSDNGKLLVAQGGSVTLWDTEAKQMLREPPANQPQEVRMSADGSMLAIQQRGEPSFERPMKGGGHEWVMPSPSIVIMQSDGKLLRLEKDLNPLADYALTPNGRMLLIGHYSGGLDVVPFVGEPKKAEGLLLASLAVSPDSKRAAVGSTDGFVHLVDLADPKKTVRLSNDDQPKQMAFSHDGKTLYLITRTSVNVLALP